MRRTVAKCRTYDIIKAVLYAQFEKAHTQLDTSLMDNFPRLSALYPGIMLTVQVGMGIALNLPTAGLAEFLLIWSFISTSFEISQTVMELINLFKYCLNFVKKYSPQSALAGSSNYGADSQSLNSTGSNQPRDDEESNAIPLTTRRHDVEANIGAVL
jgi:hypothetical protein